MNSPSEIVVITSEVREKLTQARYPVVLSGAGISAESGVPTFRGKDGLWNNHRAEELATPEAFARDPQLVWRFYDWRRGILNGIKPNAAHTALARAEDVYSKLTIITQNVDGLHGLAGSKNVLELHGNIWRVRCTVCGVVSENRDVPITILPYCDCGGLLRPDIVWFGESLPEEIFENAYKAARECDFMFVIGTAGVVQPAASLATLARNNGAYTVEINTERTGLSDSMDAVIVGKAGQVVPEFF